MSETQVHSQTLPVGEVLDDYRITSVLGQGGFGITYKASEETLQREVAIKEYLPQQFAYRDGTGHVHPRSDKDEELFQWGLTRFLDEARALAMFRHPNIISVMRFFQRNGTAYLVMEFEEGMDLGAWLASHGRPDEELLVHGILGPLLEGLARVHDKGLLHRDIKPDNVFMRRDGTPVLIDFGASRPHGPQATSNLTSIISAGYSPFEQYGTGERQGPWSDLYALAGTMYRVVAGEPPVDAIARQQGTPLRPAVEAGQGAYSQGLLETLDRALAVDIDERPQDARAFLRLLGLTPPPEQDDPGATFVRPAAAGTATGAPAAAARPRRKPLWALAGLVLAAVAAGGGYWWMNGEVDPRNWLAAATGAPAEEPAEQSDGESAEAPAETAAVSQRPEPSGSASPPAGEPQPQPDSAPDEPVVARDPEDAEAPAQAPQSPPGGGEEPDPEDRIVAGLDLSSEVRSFRREQLLSALLAYTSIRERFEACQRSGCADMPALVQELQSAMETQNWRRGGIEGAVELENPRRLESDDCPFMIDVREWIDAGGERREQQRTYCTSNGFDRVVQEASGIT
ncbi:MAG: serine/threonine protein kinase [Pseudomonadota bacterium]